MLHCVADTTGFPSVLFFATLVSSHLYRKEGEHMAEEQQVAEEKSLGKLAWGYVGVGVLWVCPAPVAGIAFERLGLTSRSLLWGPVWRSW